jgi:Holliday junction resolvasome RuvABC endonuclease subunit
MTLVVIGLDYSLTSTGLARIAQGQPGFHHRKAVASPKLAEHDRLEWLGAEVVEYVAAADLVAMEAPAWGATSKTYHQLAGGWWHVKHELWRLGVPVALVNVGSLKGYVTGSGVAGKDDMIRETCHRFGTGFTGGNDEADALGLAAMAADQLGFAPAQMPAAHRAHLKKVPWPDMTRRVAKRYAPARLGPGESEPELFD